MDYKLFDAIHQLNEAETSINTTKEDTEKIVSELIAMDDEISTLKNDIKTLDGNISKYDSNANRLFRSFDGFKVFFDDEKEAEANFNVIEDARRKIDNLNQQIDAIQDKYGHLEKRYSNVGPDDYDEWEEWVVDDEEGLAAAEPEINRLRNQIKSLAAQRGKIYSILKEIGQQKRKPFEDERTAKQATLKNKESERAKKLESTDFALYIKEKSPCKATVSIKKEQDGIHYYATFEKSLEPDDIDDIELDYPYSEDYDIGTNFNANGYLDDFVTEILDVFNPEDIETPFTPDEDSIDADYEDNIEVKNYEYTPADWNGPAEEDYDLDGTFDMWVELEFHRN